MEAPALGRECQTWYGDLLVITPFTKNGLAKRFWSHRVEEILAIEPSDQLFGWSRLVQKRFTCHAMKSAA